MKYKICTQCGAHHATANDDMCYLCRGKHKKRGQALADSYIQIINGERQDSYGNPEDSFKDIAKWWGWYLDIELKPEQIAFMMALFKVCREKHQKKRDNVVDMAGYLGIYDDIVGGEK